MTLYQFMKLQASKRWKRFFYLTENQGDFDTTFHPVKMSLTFDTLTVSTAPGGAGLFLMRDKDFLSICTVKRISCAPCVLGDILTVECQDGTSYILVAQD